MLRPRRRSLDPLISFVLLAACSHQPPSNASRALAPDAPLPLTFAPTTLLRLGDPQVQKQLELSGELARLPFKVEWQNISGGPQTLEAFRGQALDGGAVGDTPPIHAAFTGLDIKIIAVNERASTSYRLALAPGAGIAKLDDLRGKRIAYSPGQAQGALVLRILRKLQLRTDQVQLVELGSSEFKDALASRQVDAAPLIGPPLVRYLKENSALGARAIDPEVRDGLSFFYVRSAVLSDPDKAAALREYVKARTRAQLWAASHREEWLRAYYVRDQHLTEEEGRSLLSQLRYPADWSDAIAGTQETVDLLARASGRPTFRAEKLFDLRFQTLAAEAALAAGAEAQLRRSSR